MDYELNDGHLLRRLMRCPDKGGTRHTVRSLADATGLSKSKISNMLNDRSKKVPEGAADATAEAVGEQRKALFTPIASTSTDADNEEGPPT
ncbi:hypothetical protein PV350_31260 [Streptomyces sp. PA03-6a]|nr:hypothetical protein [Streptomyces sp. PA03-6a]